MVKEKVLKILEERKSEGIVQSELLKLLKVSKSYLSEILSELEYSDKIIRKRIKKDYVIYLRNYYKDEPEKDYIKIGFIKALEYFYLIPIIEKLRNRYRILIKTFDNGIEVLKGLINNIIDVALAPLPTVLIFNIIYKNMLKILPYGSIGGSHLILRRSIESYDKTGEVKFGTTPLSSMEQFLIRILENFGLNLDNVRIVYYTSADKMVKDFNKKYLDGISIWMPYSMDLKNVFEYEYSKIFEIPCCIFVTRSTINEKTRENLIEILNELNINNLMKNRKEILMKFIKLSNIELKRYKNFDVKILKDINLRKINKFIIPIKNTYIYT